MIERIGIGLFVTLLSAFAFSAETETAAKSEEGPLISSKLKPAKKKGKWREQKETEGTEALGRFQADTILKSPYNVDGQSLEVDPD